MLVLALDEYAKNPKLANFFSVEYLQVKASSTRHLRHIKAGRHGGASPLQLVVGCFTRLLEIS